MCPGDQSESSVFFIMSATDLQENREPESPCSDTMDVSDFSSALAMAAFPNVPRASPDLGGVLRGDS